MVFTVINVIYNKENWLLWKLIVRIRIILLCSRTNGGFLFQIGIIISKGKEFLNEFLKKNTATWRGSLLNLWVIFRPRFGSTHMFLFWQEPFLILTHFRVSHLYEWSTSRKKFFRRVDLHVTSSSINYSFFCLAVTKEWCRAFFLVFRPKKKPD